MTTKPKKPFTLYWSNLVSYEGCPRAFLWGRGWGDIDVGGGPGRRKPIVEDDKRSAHHAVMGIAIQAAIEAFYNLKWYQNPKEALSLMLEEATKHFEKEMLRAYIDWRFCPPRTEMLDTVLAGVKGFLVTLKHHKLLGGWAKAEMDLLTYIKADHPIGGKADTIIQRQDTGVTSLDGKNSTRYMDKKTKAWFFHTDPDQLRWYALCYYLRTGELVDRLGFVYYRYPYGYTGPEGFDVTPSEGVSWVSYTKEDLQGLADRAVAAREGMNNERFDPNPSPQGCKFCDFVGVCDARQAQIKENSRGSRKKSILPDAAGFTDLEL